MADFKLQSHQPGFLVAQSDHAELSFIDPTRYWAHGHPFSGRLTGSGQGLGIEIGIVVADLDKAFAAAQRLKEKGWPIGTAIARRPWGSRDFRVLAPEGYSFRFTEGHRFRQCFRLARRDQKRDIPARVPVAQWIEPAFPKR